MATIKATKTNVPNPKGGTVAPNGTKKISSVWSEVTLDQLKSYDNTSKKIRALAAYGYKPGDIERIFEHVGVTTREGTHIRYQHIRNVLHTVLSNPEHANDNPSEVAADRL